MLRSTQSADFFFDGNDENLNAEKQLMLRSTKSAEKNMFCGDMCFFDGKQLNY